MPEKELPRNLVLLTVIAGKNREIMAKNALKRQRINVSPDNPKRAFVDQDGCTMEGVLFEGIGTLQAGNKFSEDFANRDVKTIKKGGATLIAAIPVNSLNEHVVGSSFEPYVPDSEEGKIILLGEE